MPQTLWGLLANGAPTPHKGLVRLKCRDSGAVVTVKTGRGVTSEPSRDKGQIYEIMALRDCAPWNPNAKRATIRVRYGERVVHTYLDERFNDEVVE